MKQESTAAFAPQVSFLASRGDEEGAAMLIPNMPKVKMSEMGDGTVPEGTYSLRVHKANYVPEPKNKNASPYINTWLVITNDGQFTGRMLFMNYTLTGKGSYRLRELLSVTGHDDEFELDDAGQLLGLEFSALVMVENGTGGFQAKNYVKRHLPLMAA